ncbi:MAG: DUF4258 domain-containing protein [Nitrospirae bacterium]|nr:DUF4258 domain-containing protein [Nitrospirota bacterium]
MPRIIRQMKPAKFSDHAKLQMTLRGASEEEVITAIRSARWEPAKPGKLKTKYRFDFNKVSLTNQKIYKYKTVEPIFADENDRIVVITV